MIDEIKEIPCLPQVSMELIRQAFQDEPEIQKLAAIVEQDTNLCANLFKTVNSAAFGPKVEIMDINQAISLMGLDMLRSTVVSLAVGDYFTINFSGQAALCREQGEAEFEQLLISGGQPLG